MVTATKDWQEWDKSTQILIECLEIGGPKFNHQRNNLINHQQVYINNILDWCVQCATHCWLCTHPRGCEHYKKTKILVS